MKHSAPSAKGIREVVRTNQAPKSEAYSQGIVVRGGSLLYTAGQTSRDPTTGRVVGKGDFRAQVWRTLENVKAIVEAAGSSVDKIVKTTTYLTDIRTIETYSKIRLEFYRNAPPASTTVAVDALADPDLMIEVEAVALID